MVIGFRSVIVTLIQIVPSGFTRTCQSFRIICICKQMNKLDFVLRTPNDIGRTIFMFSFAM